MQRCMTLALGTFVAMLAGAARPAPLAAQTGTVKCESRGAERDKCPIDRGTRVELVRHLSQTPCRENANWGVGQGFIWVSGGCRAEFSVTTLGYVNPGQGNPPVTEHQLRACRSEADRRLAGYSYEQIEVEPVSRDQNVSRVRWRAGNAVGMCTVATNGRVLAFSVGNAGEFGGGGGEGNTGVTRLTCESKSTGRQECGIPRGARITLIKQLSQNPCRLNDTYGTGDGYIWVAKGCRGEFEVTRVVVQPPVVQPPVVGPPQTRRIVCQSVGNTQNTCPIPAGSTVRLSRQIGPTPCQANVSYGITDKYIWVNRGCAAEFEVTFGGTAGGNAGGGTGLPDRVTCESKGGERTECRIRTGGQVQLVRQLSSSPCTRFSTWGSGDGVIWVTKGCRGEFEVR